LIIQFFDAHTGIHFCWKTDSIQPDNTFIDKNPIGLNPLLCEPLTPKIQEIKRPSFLQNLAGEQQFQSGQKKSKKLENF
jgi:hypothetical protein